MTSATIVSSNSNPALTILDCLKEHKFPKELRSIVLSYWCYEAAVNLAFAGLKMVVQNLNKAALLSGSSLDKTVTQTLIAQFPESEISKSQLTFLQKIVAVAQVTESIRSLALSPVNSDIDAIFITPTVQWHEVSFAGNLSQLPPGFGDVQYASLVSNVNERLGDPNHSPYIPSWRIVRPAGANFYLLLDGNLYHFLVRAHSPERTTRNIVQIQADPKFPWTLNGDYFNKTTFYQPIASQFGNEFVFGNMQKGDYCPNARSFWTPIIQEYSEAGQKNLREEVRRGIPPRMKVDREIVYHLPTNGKLANQPAATTAASSSSVSSHGTKRKTDSSSDRAAKKQNTDATASAPN